MLRSASRHIIVQIKSSLLVVLLLALSPVSFAQYETTDSVTVDTSYTSISNAAPPEFDLQTTDSVFYKTYVLADSVVDRLKKDEAFWYANLEPKREKKKEEVYDPKEPFFLKPWFRTILWIIIIGGFLAVLIWFLMSSDVRLFRKKPSVIYSVSDDAIPDDIFSIDYEKELERSIASKNMRLSVRLMFLHTLRLLADRELIDYKIEKTNSDYLGQLFNTGYYKDFFQLTKHFEYVWYGKFEPSDKAFEAIRKEYQTLKSRLQA